MKVLLVAPPIMDDLFFARECPPYGIYLLQAVLREPVTRPSLRT